MSTPEEPAILRRYRTFLRIRYLVIPALICLVILIGLFKDGAGGWISTAASVALLAVCLGFYLGIDFADRTAAVRQRSETWRTRNGSPD